MKILVSTRSLAGVGGTRTFNFTLISELKKRGHEVEYYALIKGLASDKIEELGVQEAASINYDLILASLEPTIDELIRQNFTGPIVQFCHSISSGGELPHPKANGHIAMSAEIQKHIKEIRGVDAPVIINGIDCNRFRPRRKIRKTPKVVVSIVQNLKVCEMIDEACKMAGLEHQRLNKYKDVVWDVEKEIDKADMVVALGRGCYEAMACGRPVVIFDKGKKHPAQGDGYLYPELFDKFSEHNCNGRAMELKFTVEELAEEFKKYDRDHGPMLREIALQKVNMERQVDSIMEYCQPIIEQYNYPGTVDVVYPLGRGSQWGDNEIRYSIRSFKKHFKDLRNVVVVGEKPAWMKGVVHIPYPDKMDVNRDARIIMKISQACKDKRVSENFIMCSDDTFLNRDLCFEDFTGWHEGPIIYDAGKDLEDHRKVGSSTEDLTPSNWFKFVYNTGNELKKRGLPDNNYDRAHAPQPVNKTEFLKVIKQWDFVSNNYTVKNIYLNCSQIFKGENIRGRNLKIYNPLSRAEIIEYLNGKWVWNIGKKSTTASVKDVLSQLYSEPTGYEIFMTPEDKRTAVEKWFKNGCNYHEGVAIFRQFAPKNFRLHKFFELNKNTKRGEIKLHRTLRLWMR